MITDPAEEFQRRLTYKGTVTILAEVRRGLGVQLHGEVRFRVAEGRVELLPPTTTLETAFGSVEPRMRPENFQELHDKAVAEHVRAVLTSQQG
jgi:bifunctional DNA-binding transcriptional regulator/antitoxin component of YhaV-PrlF toxin-antitoxin module